MALMNRLSGILAVLAAMFVGASCVSVSDIDAMRQPRYEKGANKGARFCATCHETVYTQWSTRSRHAQATKSPQLHHAIAEFKDHPVLSQYMDESMCFSCHGSKTINEGVNCETCHGAVLRGVPIEVTHEKKFTPRLEILREKSFCAKCHQVTLPVSGELLTSTYDDWKASPAAKKGKTCRSCHMAKRGDDERAYHGFDTASRDISIYKNDLRLSGIARTVSELRVTLENRVLGHSVPAGGPTRVLALELTLHNASGRILHRDTRRFAKVFSMLPLIGVVPDQLIENTQLQAGEKRRLRFPLPDTGASRIDSAKFTLRMYEVADRHHADITKAHWRSKPILVKQVRMTSLRTARR